MNLYTKNGRPLQVHDDIVYSKGGKVVGKIDGNKVFDQGGQYVGTIVEGHDTYGWGAHSQDQKKIPHSRFEYRPMDAGASGSPFTAEDRAPIDKEPIVPQVMRGREPQIPD